MSMRKGFVAALLAGLALWAMAPAGALATPKHGIAMYGEPSLPPDFVALPYANPDAPKGGRVVFGEVGGFDSLNPFILKGRAPWGIGAHMYEGLLGRNWDEPFSLYGLLAESVEVPADRSWAEFTLRPEARFSDGSPVTVDDVIWSFETLGTEGHPRYANAWGGVARVEATGPRSVRFTFNAPDRELPLIMGLRPILQKAQWADRSFAESGLDVPVASGPYVIDRFEPGRFIAFRRNPDYWGADLPINRGRHNLDEIRYEYYGDSAAAFEAFKAGAVTVWREDSAARWRSAYGFPAVAAGDVVKSEIPHRRPSGIRGLVMNTRRAPFDDWRVREALIQAFPFEFINATLNGEPLPRITSYFANSPLAMRPGPAEGPVAALLAPFAASLPPGAIEGYALPVSDGTVRNRAGLRRATGLLEEAGWTVADGALRNAAGEGLTFDILLRSGDSANQAIVDIYIQVLERLGIVARIVSVDDAQYRERTDLYDFDMTPYARFLSLSPGNEQRLYWGSAGVTEPGTRNWMGMASPAADALIETLLAAETQDAATAAIRALDRVLTSGRYVIPFWYSDISRLAHRAELRHPATIPLYGDWTGFLPDVWWAEPGLARD
jgi:peptide/nickel transport system substrate-binding protein